MNPISRKDFLKTSIATGAGAAVAMIGPSRASAQETAPAPDASRPVGAGDTRYTGLSSLLTPQNSVVLLIDHQPFQFANVRNQDPTMVMNNTVALAKSAKTFGVPTILTTVLGERGGHLSQQIQDVFPEQKPIDRSWINAWQDERIPAAVKATGRKKIVMAALWTEICLAFPAIQALGEGYDVFVVTDASGGVSTEAHERGIARCIQAGAVPITWMAVCCEWQRDWARSDSLAGVGALLVAHGGSSGTSFAWEMQLLAQGAKKSGQ